MFQKILSKWARTGLARAGARLSLHAALGGLAGMAAFAAGLNGQSLTHADGLRRAMLEELASPGELDPPDDGYRERQDPEMESDGKKKKKGPGQYDALDMDAKKVLSPDVHDGLRFMASAPLIQKVKYSTKKRPELQKAAGCSSTLWLGSRSFGEGVSSMLEIGQFVYTPNVMLYGSMGSLGDLKGRWNYTSKEGVWSTQNQFMVSSAPDGRSNYSCKVLYESEASSAAAAVTSDSISTMYVQGMGKDLAVGCQYVYLKNQVIAPLLVKFRRRNGSHTTTGGMGFVHGQVTAEASYSSKIKTKDYGLQLATMLNVAPQKTMTAVGVKVDFKQTPTNPFRQKYNLVVDSDFNMMTTYSEAIIEGTRAGISCKANVWKDEYDFGLSLQIGE